MPVSWSRSSRIRIENKQERKQSVTTGAAIKHHPSPQAAKASAGTAVPFRSVSLTIVHHIRILPLPDSRHPHTQPRDRNDYLFDLWLDRVSFR
ncbi:hypothetical protein ACFX2A_040974 [Malus domestica]